MIHVLFCKLIYINLLVVFTEYGDVLLSLGCFSSDLSPSTCVVYTVYADRNQVFALSCCCAGIIIGYTIYMQYYDSIIVHITERVSYHIIIYIVCYGTVKKGRRRVEKDEKMDEPTVSR